MSGRVIVVGSVNVDLVVRGERLPGPGETVTGGTFERHHGGKGGNQAVAAARLGRPTLFVGAVGDDEFGIEARAALAAEGIDLRGLVTLDARSHRSGPDPRRRRRREQHRHRQRRERRAGPPNSCRPVFAHRPRPGDVVLVGHEIPTGSVRAALRQARDAGAATILNPAPAHGSGHGHPGPCRHPDAESRRAGGARGGTLPGQAGPVAQDLLAATGVRAVLVSLGARWGAAGRRESITRSPPRPSRWSTRPGRATPLNGPSRPAWLPGCRLCPTRPAERSWPRLDRGHLRGRPRGLPRSVDLQPFGD